MSDKKEEFINWVNTKFRPENPKYPVGFKSKDRYLISGECAGFIGNFDGMEIFLPVIDYYGENLGGHPWIEPSIQEKAKSTGLFLEWVDPSCVVVNEE